MQGNGFLPGMRVNNAQGKELQYLMQKDIWAGVEEAQASRTVRIRKQGALTKWENELQRKITRAHIWKADFHYIGFSVQAVYNVLPSSANRHF